MRIVTKLNDDEDLSIPQEHRTCAIPQIRVTGVFFGWDPQNNKCPQIRVVWMQQMQEWEAYVSFQAPVPNSCFSIANIGVSIATLFQNREGNDEDLMDHVTALALAPIARVTIDRSTADGLIAVRLLIGLEYNHRAEGKAVR